MHRQGKFFLLSVLGLIFFSALYVLPVINDSVLLGSFRIPALLTAALAGIGLSVSGMILQSFFRNPLAGPFVMGSASGASLGVAAILFLLPNAFAHYGLFPAALVGSMSTTLGIVLLARRASSLQILVAGMLFAQVCAALVSILIRFGEERQLKTLVTWNQASFQGNDLHSTLVFGSLIAFSLALLWWRKLSLDALLLGEEAALFTGHYGPRDRIFFLCMASLLTALVVSWCGPLAFVGLITPLLTQVLLRSARHSLLIPANALLGALIGVAVLYGQEWGEHPLLPVDAVASLLSVPFLLIYLWKKNHVRH